MKPSSARESRLLGTERTLAGFPTLSILQVNLGSTLGLRVRGSRVIV